MNTNEIEWTHRVHQTFKSMLSVANKQALPQYFHDDLEGHQATMTTYPHSKFLWMLRENGSIVVPIKKGLDLAYVTEYVDQGPVYLITPNADRIEALSKERAIEIFSEPPVDLQKCATVVSVVSAVQVVLREWEGYATHNADMTAMPSDWHKWVAYFEYAGNYLMSSFLVDALNRLIEKKVN